MKISNLVGNDVVEIDTIDKTVFTYLDKAISITSNNYKLQEFGRLADLDIKPTNIPFNDINEKLGRVGIDEEIIINNNLGGIKWVL